MSTPAEESQAPASFSWSIDKHWSPNVVLSMVTGPFLMGLIGAHALVEGLTQLGIASEEFFRGERLPSIPTGSKEMP